MRFFRDVAALAASCLLFTSTVNAHSRARNPLNYISLIEEPRLHTPSQRVHAFSTFDITFDLHNHAEHVRLSLEPNHDIIHEDSYTEFIDKDGNVRHAEKMQREDYKVFQGQSYIVDEDGISSHVGWARIFVSRDGVRPLFEGAFTIMGNHHHIQLSSAYMSTKHEFDPELELDDDEYMTVWRDSDISRQDPYSHLDLKRSLARSCGSDQLDFNTHPDHPIYRELKLRRDESTWGTMSVANLFGKRQNIDGGGAGSGNLRVSIFDPPLGAQWVVLPPAKSPFLVLLPIVHILPVSTLLTRSEPTSSNRSTPPPICTSLHSISLWG